MGLDAKRLKGKLYAWIWHEGHMTKWRYGRAGNEHVMIIPVVRKYNWQWIWTLNSAEGSSKHMRANEKCRLKDKKTESDRDHQCARRAVWQWQKVLRTAHMVGASVGHPGRQTGGLRVHLELSPDTASRQGGSGSQPSSHTYKAFTGNTEQQRQIQTSTIANREGEIGLAIKCVVSSLQRTATARFVGQLKITCACNMYWIMFPQKIN